MSEEGPAEWENIDCVDCHQTVHIEFPNEKYGPRYPDELLCHECELKRLDEEIAALEDDLEAAIKDRNHWKANSENLAKLKRKGDEWKKHFQERAKALEKENAELRRLLALEARHET